MSAGKTNRLDVKPYNTVKEIKQIMEEKEGIPLTQQKLYYMGCELKNDQSVSECEFNDYTYSEVHLVCRSQSPIQIKVLTPDSKQITLTVDGTDTIETIKRKMKEFPPSQHALVFAGKELQDNLTLYDQSIQNGSMLHLKYKEPALSSTLSERFLEPFSKYQLLTFYVDFPSTRVWNVHFVVIDSCIATREKVFAEMKLYKKGESEVFFSFKNSAISFDCLEEEVLPVNGWRILPLQSPLKIYKKDVDYYCSNQGILPKVTIRVEALSADSLSLQRMYQSLEQIILLIPLHYPYYILRM
ncbi:PREDICTED: ubiquitin-60S ribosomal protein L40-like [Amphimedon queenslandica]|uniref:Ubiquitin-like domain-containing protein n=2 Tax=Amphimedon queenslandica TaxID=400682 RepID=A0AAN0JDS2_AMPQE|nr:PREDICTED: ubiquitin-60S ribosomal protein L40-like [Amphimedon queenslandica]|eukprot:XP_019855144.1 PREDICTED: ubiquitin-60S ribosomal protein L40-like [Amphimedon queenslandica]